jgi:preprotein translocase subunit SecG
MTILLGVLLFVEVVCSLLLIGVILLQKTKGQGVGLAFGAGMGESLFGAQMGNVLTKTTIILGIVFLVNTTVISLLQVGRQDESAVDAEPILPAGPVSPGPAGGPGAGAPPTDFQPPAGDSMPGVEATVPIGPLEAPTVEPVAEPGVEPSGEAAAEPAAAASDEAAAIQPPAEEADPAAAEETAPPAE